MAAWHGTWTGLRTNPRYEQILELVKRNVSRAPLVGNAAYDILHGIKIGLKDVPAPQGLFSDLGLKYVGPVDGHDIAEVERALRQAHSSAVLFLVHCITRKGNGFKAAENHEEDRFHAVGKINSTTGEAVGGCDWADSDRSVLRRAFGWAAPTNVSSPLRRRWCIQRGCTASRRRSPIAASTSESPSSTPSRRQLALRWVAYTRS